jgi:class 3 adenylate cyclase
MQTEPADSRTPGTKGTLTILFTDLEGSTDLRVRIGDVAANDVMHMHDECIRSRLMIAGAIESKSLGDGFMALFTSANQAIETAVAIQRAIEDHNRANANEQIAVRIGLNSGDVVQTGSDAHGMAVHAASRICGKAQGGQILVSQLVHDLAGTLGDARLADRGLFSLKGFPERWRLFEVLWRDKEAERPRASREVKAASAAAFDHAAPRSTKPVVGRAGELQVVERQLGEAASSGLRAVILEGEAGIGKTRMLDAVADMAASLPSPFWVLDVAADEELRGPFLLFRTLLNSPRMAAIAKEAMALEVVERAKEAFAGRAERPDGLSAQEQMMRTFDEVSSAFVALTNERPLALLLDDVQWADEDSLQLIRYLVRTLATGSIFLLISLRPYTESASAGAGKLIADLDRMRVTQVLRLQRLSRLETGELLRNLLGAPVAEATLDSLHARSEGVPFFTEELARAYREADALQLIDGTWTMTKLSGPAVPSSIQSLIERRLAQLDPDCRTLLADAGVLGRRFRLTDLSRVLAAVNGVEPKPAWQLGEDLVNGVNLGLISEEPDGSPYDFAFSHDQIRASLLGSLSRQRKRAIHGAIAATLASEGGPDRLSMLAYHALQAGDEARALAATMEAARAAMGLYAPEEAVRLIDAALPVASRPEDRIEMLRLKDDALELLDREGDRLANLAEMTALTGAIPSPALEAEVKLRRASAAHSAHDFEMAADLARAVMASAAAIGDSKLELAAALALGEAMTRSRIGESYMALAEADLNAAEKAFTTALAIARQIGSRSGEADALRELAVVETGRVKHIAVAAQNEGASGIEIVMQGPALFAKAKDLAEQAFHIYEEIGDRRGLMSSLIAMAYAHVTDPTARGMAGRIEHIRALHHSRVAEVTESQRARDDALMLYSIATYAGIALQPGLAVERGREAFEAARALGDRWLETLCAGGLAMAYLSFGGVEEAGAWLERAASSALAVASSSMARRLEMWRGAFAAARDDAETMVLHYERAAGLAGQKNLGARCEALSTMAIECARIGSARDDETLLIRARQAAEDTLDSVRLLRGKLPWEAEASAALAVVDLAEGNEEAAAEHARAALDIDGDTFLTQFINVLWAAGRVLIASGQPEAAALSAEILGGFAYIGMTITDPVIKARWFDVPRHKELAQIVGFDPSQAFEDVAGADLTEEERGLLGQLASGTQLASDQLSGLLAKLGVETESEAIEFAIKAGVTWR